MTVLTDPLTIRDVTIQNRLYRAPVLECAGTGPGSIDRLIDALEPAAAAGAGLVMQGATVVTETGGCVAPGMSRTTDPTFKQEAHRLPTAIESHGGSIFIQLDHGGLRSVEAWHRKIKAESPQVEQLAVSPPPRSLRLLDSLGALDFSVNVLTTDGVYELAESFGQAADDAVSAGYHGIHLAGANMGIIEQFLSPAYNRRTDVFGGKPGTPRLAFIRVLYEAIRSRVGESVPIIIKIPAESAGPPLVRGRLSLEDGVDIARACEQIGYDAVVPVTGSGFWDASIIRGEYPQRAWNDRRFQSGYTDAFGPLWRRLIQLANRVQAASFSREPGWNESFCRAVSERVDIPVFIEGGIRERRQIDRLLSEGIADAVGMARPFYAEPELPARLLQSSGARALCESCNNCTIPQVTGARGICRTPSILEEKGRLAKDGAYEKLDG